MSRINYYFSILWEDLTILLGDVRILWGNLTLDANILSWYNDIWKYCWQIKQYPTILLQNVTISEKYVDIVESLNNIWRYCYYMWQYLRNMWILLRDWTISGSIVTLIRNIDVKMDNIAAMSFFAQVLNLDSGLFSCVGSARRDSPLTKNCPKWV